MPKMIFGNNAQSSITTNIAPSAISVSVQPGTGSLFPQPQPGEIFVATLIDTATGLLNEIVWVTQRVGDTMTLVRGQEDTTPLTWPPNSAFAELWTAGQSGSMLQQGDEQGGTSTFGLDTGVANAYSVVLNPALTANVMGQSLRFKAANSNTGASTVDYGTGPAALLNAQGLPLSGGEIIANYVYETYWNGAGYNLAMPSLVRVPTGMIAPYAGGAVPTGWLACIGQLVSKDTYPSLFGVLGTVYGGDGLPNFGVPDLRGRVPAGLDGGANRITTPESGIAGNTLGAAGGGQSVILTAAQMPQHLHGIDQFQTGTNNGGGSVGGGAVLWADGGVRNATQFAGGNASHSSVQPTMMLTYMIKT